MGWFSRKQKISVDDFGQLLETYYMQYIDDLDGVENSPSMNYLIESVPEGSVNVFKVIGEFRILFCVVTVMTLREVLSTEENKIIIPQFMSTAQSTVEEFLQENETLPSIISDYFGEWDKAIIRSKKINDNSTLNNPLYCISKKASNRCINNEEPSLNGIIFFTETIKTIKAGFIELLENWKIV